MPQERREGGPAVENRWWVDTGKVKERQRTAPRQERPLAGDRFFEIARGFDQERAKARLTDLNLKLLEEARPAAGEWRVLHLLPESTAPAEVERLVARIPLPPRARGVLVDYGCSLRGIATGEPVGERIVEFTFGEHPSFDCWIRGDWVHEELFASFEDAVRKAQTYLARYLESQHDAW